jgi:membrane-bound lytic murein transglycosylase B
MKVNRNKIIIASGILILLVSILFPPRFIRHANGSMLPDKKIAFFQSVIDTLIRRGIDSAFIYKLIKTQETEFNEKYLKVNITGYLKKPDYSSHYNYESISECREFLRDNRQILMRAQVQFGVPAKVITSILWIESKFGSYTGKNHIPSVLLSTAVSNREEYIKLNLDEVEKNDDLDRVAKDSIKRKLSLRAKTKSEWALTELLYLDSIQTRMPESVFSLYGSWAGAFGLSQFLPSSYYRWAVDGNGDGKIDLFVIEDAAFSVGNYLKTNGWGDADSQRRAAVHHYNNSDDYVNAVLLLASRL